MPPHNDKDQPAAQMIELRHIRDRVDEVHKLLLGNGTPERGLVIRVDRLEQSEARRAKIVGAAVVASAGALVKAFWATFSGGGGGSTHT